MTTSSKQRVLVTGATGYIGGRIVPRLLELGYPVRCLVRSPEKLEGRIWRDHPLLEVIQGDVSDDGTLDEACTDCEAAYYLIHSMESAGSSYAERDRELARSFSNGAQRCGVKHIVYLGGLGEMGPGLSEHLRSRREVESVLRENGMPVTGFRAAMIIGSGSASFETLRYLVDRLPVMVTPKWVSTETQPIAIENVLVYLIDCLEIPESHGQSLDIGGSDVMRYRDVMRTMAGELGLPRRWIVPVPVLTPWLSSLWIGLVTPVSPKIARPLAEGLKNKTVCRNDLARQLLPQKKLYSVSEAIRSAVNNLNEGDIETNWSMAGKMTGDPDWAGGTVFRDVQTIDIDADQETVFRVVSSIGGEHGYWGVDYLWRLRGLMDQFIGGPGLRRGRRHPTVLRYGEAVDFWRVRHIRCSSRLTLHAEMKVPGDAELDFHIEPLEENRCRLTQTARFRPKGLGGILYWYSVVPLHHIVFRTMIRGAKQEAEEAMKNRDATSTAPADPPEIAEPVQGSAAN
ncbi:SDR family oxidoreductase [Rubinisphaera margarita]|uniref:SDR family oxidoreductase n=1 Tax=Rubinisphaera margarita TaxID=2909586 RepID=UPI001EE80DFA|nr:SDR family oxidoreductase [Rubinisphaera margarita]MCG6154232.1 SDR family oxidoreductase [Rubinisphaera margarita]